MHKNDIEMFALGLWFPDMGEVLTDEYCLLVAFCKEHPRFVDALLADVNAHYAATFLGEWEQDPSLATAYFQHTRVVCWVMADSI